MYKSSKRIRLEKEIFSKSIKDIEQMFNFSNDEDFKRKIPSQSNSYSNSNSNTSKLGPNPEFSRLDLPAGTWFQSTSLNYDCVNMALFLSDTQSEPEAEPIKPPTLPSSTLIPGRLPAIQAEAPRSVLWDLNDDEEVEDYKFELDLKLYLPRINLEKDLKMIDQMFFAPLHLR